MTIGHISQGTPQLSLDMRDILANPRLDSDQSSLAIVGLLGLFYFSLTDKRVPTGPTSMACWLREMAFELD